MDHVIESAEPAAAMFGREDARRIEFEDLMRAYERPILRLCLRMLRNPEDARDAAQDTFLKAYRGISGLESDRSAAPWLYRIAVNVCRDRIRARRPAAPIEPDSAASPLPLPDSAAQRRQEREIFNAGLERLTAKERSAVVLRDLEGLSTSEVASILGTTEGTVRSHLWSARLKLKKFAERWRRRP